MVFAGLETLMANVPFGYVCTMCGMFAIDHDVMAMCLLREFWIGYDHSSQYHFAVSDCLAIGLLPFLTTFLFDL